MPIFDYRCQECGRTIELLVDHYEDLPRYPCKPPCVGEMRRIPSASNFALKGGGWASDGYSKEKPPAKAKKR